MTALTERATEVPVGPGPMPPAEPSATGPSTFIWRVRHTVVCALLTGLAFGSSGGAAVADTKLDLIVDPVGFLGRALHLWDPLAASGQLQNQAYGYLFPMGPFFALGHLLGMPGWVVQRLWWSVLLCVAYTGVVVLAQRLRVGTPAARLLAGVAFATTPHLLTVLGPVSAEAWPMALSAWTLVPLVGRDAARTSARRAAFLSGVAVLCMGGVNATLVLAALVPAGTWFLTRRWGRDTLALAAWWVLAVVLACLWWLVPLALLGRYSPPFLDYIESASITTSTTSLVETLRGTHDWIGYLPASGSTAGAMLLTSGVLVVLTTLVAAAGLAGMVLRRSPHRAWLVTTFGAGVVLVTLGHVSSVDGFGAQALRSALDGALAPLRNVHKFDVALRLPLVLGLAAVVDVLGRGRSAAAARANRVLVVAAAAFAVVGAATPLAVMKVAPPHGFDAVPGYWRQAAQWLDRADATGRTLLAPGSRFGVYDWGTTNDEPLQPLARTPWDVRNTIPLTNTGHIRWLDSIEQDLAAGRGGPGLADVLRRSGVRYVLVRNDLDYGAVGATAPVRVHDALAQSPDVVKVASFGPQLGSSGAPGLAYDQHWKVTYRALEVFEVRGGGNPRVDATAATAVQRVRGGPESLLAMGRAGRLTPAAAVLTPDGSVLTDTPRLREANFAGGASNLSATLAPTDPLRIAKPRRDYAAGDLPEAFVRLDGARSVSASSSAADAEELTGVDQGAMPYSAFDGTRRTAWRPATTQFPEREWVDVDFGRSVELPTVHLDLLPGSQLQSVTVTAAGRSATTPVGGADSVDLRVPVGSAQGLRVQLGPRVRGADPDSPLGISEVEVPGVTVSRSVVLPGVTTPREVVLTTSGRRDACVFDGRRPLCATGRATLGEDAAGLDRTFTTGADEAYAVGARAVPMPGPALDRLIADAVDSPVTVRASSVAVPDPSGSAASAVDGDPGTTWVADPSDRDPTIDIGWTGRREVSRLRLVLTPGAAATPAREVTVSSPAGSRLAAVDPDGWVRFDPLRTDRLTVHLRAGALSSTFDPVQARLSHLGLGVSEVLLPGVHALASPSHLAEVGRRSVDLPCGSGPAVQVDHQQVRTAVSTTVDALRRMRPVELRVCGDAHVDLPAGTHRVRLRSTQLWGPDGVTLGDRAAGPASASAAPVVTVQRWDATSRRVLVGPRAQETVLTVHENANPGWVATLDGHRLAGVTVDGWQQGYVVPAGSRPATVELVFAPDRWMRWGMLAGALAVLALLVGAALPGRRVRQLPRPARGRGVAVVVAAVAAVAALSLVGGVSGLVAAAGAAVAWLVARRSERVRALLPWAACALLVAAGLRLALDPWGTPGYAAGARLTQWWCLGALALGFAAALLPGWEPGGAPPGSADAPGTGS